MNAAGQREDAAAAPRLPGDWQADAMSAELAIRMRSVVKRYGPITAVNGLDLDVPVGTCVGELFI